MQKGKSSFFPPRPWVATKKSSILKFWLCKPHEFKPKNFSQNSGNIFNSNGVWIHIYIHRYIYVYKPRSWVT